MADSVQTVHIDVSRLENKINALADITSELNSVVLQSKNAIDENNKNIMLLYEKFNEMMNDQKKQTALQQASTELVRVRQELENNYGNYKVIRETMLGVLQATDLALVKKSTISRVSEELMLSTPKYWLAPCLVAVSAWIGNDRDLAERAIAEAVKRDEERTAITMALICRRNNKIQTCYEWLSIYFSHQDSAKFSEGSFAYIDAYVNGIFGPDEKHMCDDYVAKWMNEIRGNSSNFEAPQEKTWKEYCGSFSRDIAGLYPELKENVQEYNNINDYVGRILSVDSIADTMSGINNAYIDQNSLKNKIDKSLIQLISRYNEDEEPLRKEEEYLKAVKYFEGDKEKARRSMIKLEQERQRNTLNLVEQMSNVITTEKDVAPSQKKTAVSFLSSYIRKGFNTYITEKRDAFPKQITLNIDGWIGTSEDGSNAAELCTDFENNLASRCAADVEKANNSSFKPKLIGAGVLGIIGLICMFVLWPLGCIMLIAAAVLVINAYKTKNDTARKIESIQQDYAVRNQNGKNKINNTLNQWQKARTVVYDFESSPVRDIIA